MDRYARSLHRALGAVAPEAEVRLLIPPAPPVKGAAAVLWRLLVYPLWARRHQGEVNHIVDHSYGHLLVALDPSRTVVTVHDIAPLLFPGRRWGLSSLAWRLAWRGAQRACFLLTDSAFMASELSRWLKGTRIQMIPLGVDPCFRPFQASERERARRRLALPEGPFLLHVGHTQPRKNLEGLLQALAILHRRGYRVPLVQVGGRPSAAQGALIAELGLGEAVRFWGRVDEETLVALYNLAAVLVFPSFYEGFGLPVLEAMACGTPVVAANAASLPEVVGDAGLLVDPHSPEALADAIARVLDDRALADDLRVRGLERAREFTWERTAEQTMHVYTNIAER
jgi:glycosyltransferase involved in cell wall biosynthesis